MSAVAGRSMLTEAAGMAGARTEEDPGREADLLLRHRAGDPVAFARLVEEYRAPVYSYLVRCGVGESDRDDLFQDIFARVHKATESYHADLPLHPWLFTIVANAVRTHLRRARVRRLVFSESDGREPASATPDGEQVSVARQTRSWLERRIRRLPLAQREVLILTCIESRPQAEVARILGIPLNTVKTHLRRARLSLAQGLARLRVEENQR